MLCGDLTAEQLSSKNDALNEVDDEVHAMTFISYADELPEAVVPMRGTAGDIIPIRDDTVFSGEYPLSVVYYMQIAPFAMEHSSTQLYIDYLLSDDVQQRLQEQGFVKLPEAIVHRNKVKLKQANAKYPMGYR
jgi:ABC-type uncharacterized transport system YnjBCD substrate-binding protein